MWTRQEVMSGSRTEFQITMTNEREDQWECKGSTTTEDQKK